MMLSAVCPAVCRVVVMLAGQNRPVAGDPREVRQRGGGRLARRRHGRRRRTPVRGERSHSERNTIHSRRRV
eukprot:5591534-Prymnesium_polylepis.1